MQRNTLLRLSLIGFFTAFLFISCDKEKENDENEETIAGSLTCKIDGVDFIAKTFNNTLIGDASAKRLDIRGTDDSGTQVIITVNDVEPLGTNFSHLGDTVFVDVFLNNPHAIKTLGTIMYSDGSFVMTLGDGADAGYSIITSCDITDRKVSGKFEFTLVDFQTDDTIFVTEGRYENMSYYGF